MSKFMFMNVVNGFHPQENPRHRRIESLGEALEIRIAGRRLVRKPAIDLLTREDLLYAKARDIWAAVPALIAELGESAHEAFANAGE
jgi:hypothetical protein